jgi:hypothetical protein
MTDWGQVANPVRDEIEARLAEQITSDTSPCKRCGVKVTWATSPHDKRFPLERRTDGFPRYKLQVYTGSRNRDSLKAWMHDTGTYTFHECKTNGGTELLDGITKKAIDEGYDRTSVAITNEHVTGVFMRMARKVVITVSNDGDFITASTNATYRAGVLVSEGQAFADLGEVFDFLEDPDVFVVDGVHLNERDEALAKRELRAYQKTRRLRPDGATHLDFEDPPDVPTNGYERRI